MTLMMIAGLCPPPQPHLHSRFSIVMWHTQKTDSQHEFRVKHDGNPHIFVLYREQLTGAREGRRVSNFWRTTGSCPFFAPLLACLTACLLPLSISESTSQSASHSFNRSVERQTHDPISGGAAPQDSIPRVDAAAALCRNQCHPTVMFLFNAWCI